MGHALLTSLERGPIYRSSWVGWDTERGPEHCRAWMYDSLCSSQLDTWAMPSGKIGVLQQAGPFIASAPWVRMGKRVLCTVS